MLTMIILSSFKFSKLTEIVIKVENNSRHFALKKMSYMYFPFIWFFDGISSAPCTYISNGKVFVPP